MRITATIEQAVRTTTRRFLQRAIRETVRIFAIAALVVVGVVFTLIAAYQALLLVWPPWAAAAACAGVAFGVALIVALVRTSRPSGQPPVAAQVEYAVDELGDELSRMTGSAKQAALDQYQRNPVGTLAGAVAVGAIIGFLKPND